MVDDDESGMLDQNVFFGVGLYSLIAHCVIITLTVIMRTRCTGRGYFSHRRF